MIDDLSPCVSDALITEGGENFSQGTASTLLSGACFRAEEQYSDYGRGHCFYRHGYGMCVRCVCVCAVCVCVCVLCVCVCVCAVCVCVCVCSPGAETLIHSILKHSSPLPSSLWINEAWGLLNALAEFNRGMDTQWGSLWLIHNERKASVWKVLVFIHHLQTDINN